jgi:hypothetical protein
MELILAVDVLIILRGRLASEDYSKVEDAAF